MKVKLFILLFILASSQLFSESFPLAKEDLSKKNLSLDRFLERCFLDDDFSYTLFGFKPMSFNGFSKNHWDGNNVHNLLFHNNLIKTFRHFRNQLNNNFLFVIDEYPNEIFIYFIHKKAFLDVINKNLDIFLSELGNEFDPNTFLAELAEEKKTLLELINYHEGLLGILLGYGRHNAMLFHASADLLGRCWGYDSSIKQKIGLSIYDNSTIEEELKRLNNILASFSQSDDYCSLVPINPLGFAADSSNEETKVLRKKYEIAKRLINEKYVQTPPLVVIREELLK